jgi:hypothetical protein
MWQLVASQLWQLKRALHFRLSLLQLTTVIVGYLGIML